MFRGTLISQVSYQIVGKIIISGLGFIVTALLARHLGVEDFGTFNFLLTIAYFAYLFADYGLQTLLIRDIAAHTKIHDDVAQFLSVRVILAGIVSLGLLGMTWFLPYSIDAKLSLVIIGIGQAVFLLMGVFWAILQGKVAFGRLVIVQVFMSIVQAILMISGVIVGASLVYFAFAHTLVVISGCVLSWLYVKGLIQGPVRMKLQLATVKNVLTRGFPFAIGLLVSVAYLKIDTLILAYFFDPQTHSDVGFYSLAYRPFEVVTVFGGYVSQTLYPLFVPLISSRKIIREFWAYLGYSLILAAGAGIFLFFGAPFIVSVLGGHEYASSVLPLKILAAAAAITILSGYFVAIALAGGKEKQLMYYGAIALAANVLLNLIWVPTGSYIATSWTTVVTQSIILLGNAYAAWHVIRATMSTKI